jgi:hypothetical protein
MKNSIKISMLISFVSLTLIFTNCSKKDDFVNLQSTISSDNSFIGTQEGKHVTFNINLTDELSEDLPIEMLIERDLESGHYINLNDFEDYFDYSSDLGQNWKRVKPNQVIIPKKSKNVKIKMYFTDDNRLETDEEFTMVITPKTGDVFKLTGRIDPIKVLVEDNEPNLDPSVQGIQFHLNDNNKYELKSVNKSVKMNKILKDYIDNGPEEKFINDLKVFTDVGGIPIKKLTLVYGHDIPYSGYVYNTGRDAKEDIWEMGINLVSAYESWNSETQSITKNSYNSEAIGHTLVHEYGHILTLNVKNEVDTETDESECKNLYLQEGCFHEESIINQFNKNFYLVDQDDLIKPIYVTNYAETNIAEDIAETFTFFIGQKNIFPDNDKSSGALKKINFLAENDRLKDLKDPIVERLSFGESQFIQGSEIREFNRTHDGKLISCLDHEQIKKLYKMHKKLR